MMLSQPRADRGRTLVLFLLFWLVFGLTTSVHDLRAYTLQQMGVDAIVTHGRFDLGHSAHPLLQPHGDTFVHEGRTLAAKQPGQFVVGALPYTVLSAAGVTYERNYDLASALVTWLSAGLLAALALAMLDRLLTRVWGYSPAASVISVSALAFGSHWLAYSGIAHHDIIAASFVVLALYCAETGVAREGVLRSDRRLFCAGLLLGLAIFTSMLPALIVAVLGAAFALRGRRYAVVVGAGFALGLSPLLAYNAWYFGSPLVPANVAGNYSDTFFAFSQERFLHHLDAYLGTGGLALWKYSPALFVGMAGLLLLPRGRAVTLLLASGLHLTYLLGIETLGTCQYGPRYLLPLLPLFAIGLAALIDLRGASGRGVRIAIALLLALTGFGVALVGALGGTMYCDLEVFALMPRMQALSSLSPQDLPLLWPCLAIGLLAAIAVAIAGSRRRSPSG